MPISSFRTSRRDTALEAIVRSCSRTVGDGRAGQRNRAGVLVDAEQHHRGGRHLEQLACRQRARAAGAGRVEQAGAEPAGHAGGER